MACTTFLCNIYSCVFFFMIFWATFVIGKCLWYNDGMDRYNHLNKYLKNKFGERVLKICVDGNFSCPNRDGTCGVGGCIFCGLAGSGENIKYRLPEALSSIKNQIVCFLNSYRGERANKFIVYFQNHTNTYDTIDSLKARYDMALSCSEKIIGLQIATRPDCIDMEIVNLLKSYQDKYAVIVELGLQTCNDEIGNAINRGYTTADFIDAVNLLHTNGIAVVAHVMVGLPGENVDDICNTIDLLSSLKVDGVKIHSTYVTSDTVLYNMYNAGVYTPITQDYYVDMVCNIIARMSPDIIIHRINADPPRELFIAPDWMLHKKLVLNAINRELDVRNIYQGCNYSQK